MRKSVIVNITLPLETWKHVQELVRIEKSNRNKVVCEAIEKYYTLMQWKILQEMGSRQAKKLGIRTEDDVDRLIHEYRKERNWEAR